MKSSAVAMTVTYNADDETFLTVLTRWHGTVLPLVLSRPLFWCMLLVQLAITYHDQVYEIRLPPIDWKVRGNPRRPALLQPHPA